MKVAIASGKGGTGKTLISTNLSYLLAEQGLDSVTYIDCDVEAPNGHLFLQPREVKRLRFSLPIPLIDQGRCSGCGACQQLCAFNAIVAIGPGEVLLFPELCHACGGCQRICPEEAISERPCETGSLLWGRAGPNGNLGYLGGRLDVGQPRAAPLIEALVSRPLDSDVVVVDAPPGTSCNAVAALRGADHVVLVTEPTPFGLHDLRLAVAVCQTLDIPHSAIINRADLGDDEVVSYLRREGIPIVAELPFDRALSDAYAKGRMGVENSPHLRKTLHRLASYLGVAPQREVRP